VIPGDAFGFAQHDRLADASGAGDGGQEPGRSGTLLQAVFELVQESGPPYQFGRRCPGCRFEGVLPGTLAG
jgi:hypothetical protein